MMAPLARVAPVTLSRVVVWCSTISWGSRSMATDAMEGVSWHSVSSTLVILPSSTVMATVTVPCMPTEEPSRGPAPRPLARTMPGRWLRGTATSRRRRRSGAWYAPGRPPGSVFSYKMPPFHIPLSCTYLNRRSIHNKYTKRKAHCKQIPVFFTLLSCFLFPFAHDAHAQGVGPGVDGDGGPDLQQPGV